MSRKIQQCPRFEIVGIFFASKIGGSPEGVKEMTDWNLVAKVFVSGIAGVFLVMALLQVSIQVSSAVIRCLEKRGKNNEAGMQK